VKHFDGSERLIYVRTQSLHCVIFIEGSRFNMEQTANVMWRIWVDTKNRIVSFHEADGCQMMEFRSHDLFLNYVDGFTGRQYRYQ
jgi:hypothetical protein